MAHLRLALQERSGFRGRCQHGIHAAVTKPGEPSVLALSRAGPNQNQFLAKHIAQQKAEQQKQQLQEQQWERLTEGLSEGQFPIALILWGVFALVMLGLWLTSVVGLYTLRRWGAWLFTATTFLGLPLYFMLDFELLQPVHRVYESLSWIITGLIIGLAFFSDAIPKPAKYPAPDPE
jgi:hypothetical protein